VPKPSPRKTTKSAKLFSGAKRRIPGGVNSPVRAYGSVGVATPPFIASARGSHVTDADGNEYIDYVGSWGPMILGHADARVLKSIERAAKRGTSFGAPTESETELAELVSQVLPSVQMLRTVSSGTEATMSAIRLARGVTGRDRILKFEGCYHGHSDGLLVGAGSGVATLGIPGSPGVPKAMTRLTVQAPFNDLEATQAAFEKWGDDIACIIVEPIAGNMGFIAPRRGFLQGLRKICDRYGALLIFDEVMTGFRVARGGAQRLYKVKPDLTTLGKVLGGGLPAAGYGGRRDLMQRIAPVGDIYQAGTLSGNPLAVAAGIETLKRLNQPGAYEKLEARAGELADGLAALGSELGVPIQTGHAGGMFGFFFLSAKQAREQARTGEPPIRDFAGAKLADAARFQSFFAAMLERGIYLAPSAFEAGFVSLAHTQRDIRATLAAARESLQQPAAGR
jgi:glutamate-1-semialdehyde 2,1-aminomutase